MKLFITLLFALTVAGCANTRHQPPVVSGETIFIRGEITANTANEFFRILPKQRIRRVLLDSGGGDVESAIQIANAIRDNNLDVEVIGDCFSSCANYIFPAGRNKAITGLGIVAWHGNMSHLLYLNSISKSPKPESDLVVINRLAALEKEFFSSLNIDEFLCWFGKIEPYNARNLYFLGTDDMARFGLKNVSVRADYPLTDTKSYASGMDVRFIKVDWTTLNDPRLTQMPGKTVERDAQYAILPPLNR